MTSLLEFMTPNHFFIWERFGDQDVEEVPGKNFHVTWLVYVSPRSSIAPEWCMEFHEVTWNRDGLPHSWDTVPALIATVGADETFKLFTLTTSGASPGVLDVLREVEVIVPSAAMIVRIFRGRPGEPRYERDSPEAFALSLSIPAFTADDIRLPRGVRIARANDPLVFFAFPNEEVDS